MRQKLTLLFTLSTVLSFGQDTKTDSLISFVNRRQINDTVQVNALNAISKNYIWIDYATAMEYADRALNLSRELQFEKGLAIAYNLKAFCYWAFGDNELAVEMGLEATKLAEKGLPKDILAESYQTLGRGYMDLRELDKAMTYAKQAETLSKSAENWEQLAGAYNLEGVIHFINDNFDSAFIYYNKALQVALEFHIDKINLPRIISNIAECNFEHNKALAFDQFHKALALAKETNNRTAEASISAIIGRSYYRVGNFTESEKYLQEALAISRRLGLRRVIQNSYAGLVNLRVKQGKMEEAIKFMRIFYDVRDSLLNSSKTRQIVELEARHEIEQKEQAIKLLEQEKRIEKFWRDVLSIGILLTGVATFFIVRLQRSRTKKAKELLVVQHTLTEKLKEINSLRSRFFANVSHEFRTPLTLILAPLEEIQKNQHLTGKEKELITLTKRNANRILELVNQLLDLAKLEAGKMQLRIKRGDIESTLKIITSSFDSLAQNKRIRFDRTIDVGNASIWFDEDALEKIIYNLLANAFKFTPSEGKVTFNASVQKLDGVDYLTVVVEDTGEGIPDHEQAHVFLPFYQIEDNGDSSHPGTGIGLSLVNELVKLYGGTIRLESFAGTGTTFTVRIPAGRESFSENLIEPTDPIPNTIQVSG